MNQLSFDDLLDAECELIYCQLSSGFHWLRITSGHTPSAVADRVHFTLHGYDYLYETTEGKEETIGLFDGPVKIVNWNEGLAYG
ncbi:hypothetical protein [Sporosarcina newyorkensis]|uniref:Uncharacterized protein n=1 Tax=Sporosarcina newyorkensis TaxID=759851 RepID=A0A1T4YTP6_9BACL|nr:hypothetical protein [Sporosarcina newyorkensis]SKB05204.1 hypothetical protein SAMN04244570_3585 [Sporosarcina newyorkensis]